MSQKILKESRREKTGKKERKNKTLETKMGFIIHAKNTTFSIFF